MLQSISPECSTDFFYVQFFDVFLSVFIYIYQTCTIKCFHTHSLSAEMYVLCIFTMILFYFYNMRPLCGSGTSVGLCTFG